MALMRNINTGNSLKHNARRSTGLLHCVKLKQAHLCPGRAQWWAVARCSAADHPGSAQAPSASSPLGAQRASAACGPAG